MSVIAELSLFPLDKGVSLSPYVARAVKIIEQSGLAHDFGPMGTCIEGEWEEVMQTVSACFQDLAQDCTRISMSLKVDYRYGQSGRLQSKVSAVQEKLS
ncbi:MAG: MTH1187 family thiamine-binding protein [Desulfovermiculus sp.]|nr:MTH1187 family thiamine-binding protein [Desulfovermiculus sp.]